RRRSCAVSRSACSTTRPTTRRRSAGCRSSTPASEPRGGGRPPWRAGFGGRAVRRGRPVSHPGRKRVVDPAPSWEGHMTIRCRFAARTAALAAALIGTALTPQTVAAQQTEAGDAGARLLEALRQNRHTLALVDGRLSGDGAELLLSEGRASQFFLLGEEHGVAEVPV